MTGNLSGAAAILKQLQDSATARYIPGYLFAIIYAGLGDADRVPVIV